MAAYYKLGQDMDYPQFSKSTFALPTEQILIIINQLPDWNARHIH
jgi:hypothetical protein